MNKFTTGSKFCWIKPRLGDAFFTSAIRAGRSVSAALAFNVPTKSFVGATPAIAFANAVRGVLSFICIQIKQVKQDFIFFWPSYQKFMTMQATFVTLIHKQLLIIPNTPGKASETITSLEKGERITYLDWTYTKYACKLDVLANEPSCDHICYNQQFCIGKQFHEKKGSKGSSTKQTIYLCLSSTISIQVIITLSCLRNPQQHHTEVYLTRYLHNLALTQIPDGITFLLNRDFLLYLTD
jgi:hypothetical protein